MSLLAEYDNFCCMSIQVQRVVKMKNNRINYTQVVWEITKLLQEAESLEDALRTSLSEVVKAVGAEAGTI